MATKFSIVVAGIKTQLDADWPDNGVEFTEGGKARAQNDSPNRVNWTRMGGRSEPVDGIGPKIHAAAAAPSVDVSSAAILTDAYDVECLVWGSDEEVADRIRESVIRAAHKAFSVRTVEAGRWQDRTEGEDAHWMETGAAHLVAFVFRVPILGDVETELALVASLPFTKDYVSKADFDTIPKSPPDLTEPP